MAELERKKYYIFRVRNDYTILLTGEELIKSMSSRMRVLQGGLAKEKRHHDEKVEGNLGIWKKKYA